MTTRIRRFVLAATAALALVLAACGDDDADPTPSTAAGDETAESSTTQAGPSTTPSAPTATTPPGQPGSGSSQGGSGETPTTSTPTTSTPAPTEGFTAVSVDHPDECTPGSVVTPTLTWSTSGATGMALSVDNPGSVGSFGTYPATGTAQMPAIGCTGAPGEVLTHVYDLHTEGLDPVDHRSVTVAITVVDG